MWAPAWQGNSSLHLRVPCCNSKQRTLEPLGLGCLPGSGRGSQQSGNPRLLRVALLSWLHASPQPLCIPYPSPQLEALTEFPPTWPAGEVRPRATCCPQTGKPGLCLPSPSLFLDKTWGSSCLVGSSSRPEGAEFQAGMSSLHQSQHSLVRNAEPGT